MSAIAEPGPVDLGTWWRKLRVPTALVLTGIVLVSILAALGRAANATPLDPRNATSDGTRALAALLAQRGDTVTIEDRASALSTRATNTIVLSNPGAVANDSLRAIAAGESNVVVVSPDDRALNALGVSATFDSVVTTNTLEPGCGLPAAVVAGSAQIDGFAYRPGPGGSITTCYSARGDASLLVMTRPSGGRTVVMGSASTLTNGSLAAAGDAALGLGLIDNPTVQWAPGTLQSAAGPGSKQGLLQLLPPRLLWATLQLFIAVVVLALWRARRLGPLVAEPLPVVVRAAETVEGSGRLLHAARARAGAATALRAATVSRITRRLRIAPDTAPAAVVAGVAEQTEREPAAVNDLLYGGAPSDDAALVRLGGDLAKLEVDVRRDSHPGGPR